MSERDLWEIENSFFEEGYSVICGIDEAGRGPLAGRVYAAAVILPPGRMPDGLDDSKKLSAKKREELYNLIIELAVSYGVGYAEVSEIEQMNIARATFLAMDRAYSKLDPVPQLLLIDGNRPGDFKSESRCVIKGDQLSASIAAASILAKVSRDRYMVEMSGLYPQYAFEKHKGYGTREHYEYIRTYGQCPIHRPSFLKTLDTAYVN